MTEPSTPRDDIPQDILHERLSRGSATEAPEALVRDGEIERARTSLAETTSCDSAVQPTVEKPSIGKVLDTESGNGTAELAIDVDDFKELYSHGVKRRDLRGLDLKVPKGIIYGFILKDPFDLLGLLTFIAGLFRCPEGRVRVLGSTPGIPGSCLPGPGFGYATKGLLGPKLTVREYLHLFGKIYGMSKTSIRHRIRILSEMFPLPDDTLLLEDLKVDEGEVVHLVAGLIHSPAILVLLNPFFCSSDPIVRMRVWHQLRRLTREEGLTILLASSHTELLKYQCDMVGIMCSGRIVAEGSPRLLLNEFKTDTLAEVFLQLTLADEEKPIIDENQLKELLITETRNQDSKNEVDGQNIKMNPTSDVKSVLSLDPTRATEHRDMPDKSPSGLLELTKMNLILLTSGHGYFLKQLLTLLFVFYALAAATLVLGHQAIASEKALNVSTDSVEDISNISTASPGDTLEADRDPSASESMLSGLMFSLIFGMGLAAGTIGSESRCQALLCQAAAGARRCDIIAASLLTHMCVMLILQAFLLVPVFACFHTSDSIHLESVGLIIVLCYLQGLQGMLMTGRPPRERFFRMIPFMFYGNTFFSGTTVRLDTKTYAILAELIQSVMPQRLPGRALEYIIFRGWGIEYYEVWLGILASIAWSSILALVTFVPLVYLPR